MIQTEKLKVAAVQLNSTGDRAANIERARDLMTTAAAQGARLICLPENFSYLDREGEKLKYVESLVDGPGIEMTRRFAQQNSVFVAAGTVPLTAEMERKVTNTLLVWGPDGEMSARYDKLHLFDIALDESHDFRESDTIQAGSTVTTCEVDGWVIGLSICYDLRFPELYRALAAQGATVLLVPSAFTAKTGKAHWEVLLRARAIENQCYVVAPGQWGHHNARRESWGQSLILDPWGEKLDEVSTGEGVAVAELSMEYLTKVRRGLPCLAHRRLRVHSEPEFNQE